MPLLKSNSARSRRQTNYTRGFTIAASGIFILSFDAVLIRLANVSPWDAAFWRGCFITLALMIYMAATGEWRSFRKFQHYPWVALIVCLLYGLNTALFVFSVSYTKVANTLVILCCTPLVCAIFSWLLMREVMPRRVWWTIAAASIGVVIVFAGSLKMPSWRGDAIALLLAISTGFLLTVLRRYPDFPRVPAVALGAAISVPLLAPFSAPLAVSLTSMGWLVIMGLFQKPVASVCMLTATRYLPSPEVSLFLLVETLLAPTWVWLVLGETIPALTLIGGAIVFTAMALHSWYEINREREKAG